MNNNPSLIHNYDNKIDISTGLVSKLGARDESYNLDGICRICMINDAHMINLWSSPTENFDVEFQHIKDVLGSFASVLIDENENLPHGICEKCEANIYFTYTFKRKCENSDEILRNALKRKAEEKARFESIAQSLEQEETGAEEPIDLMNIVNSIENAYPCDQCSDSFEQRLQLNQHLKKIHKRYKCNDCGEHFAQPQILRRHHKIHLGIKNKLCSVCGRGFLRSDDLKRHIRVHTGEKPFRCNQCPKSYKQSSELIQHKLTHSDVKHFTCKLCDKSMSTRNGYYIHMKVHNGQKNHECHLCDKKFVTSSERTSHIRYIHMKEKIFECTMPDCSKRFVTKICLNKHLKIHAEKMKKLDAIYNPNTIAEYECPICTKQLLSPQTLKKHMKLHETEDNTGTRVETKFVCEICEKKFAAKSTLTRHVATSHTSFTCELCGTTILDYAVFVLHRELHNNEDDVSTDESSNE